MAETLILRYDNLKKKYNHFAGTGEQLKIKINDKWLVVSIYCNATDKDCKNWYLVYEDFFQCKCTELEGYKIKPVGKYWDIQQEHKNNSKIEKLQHQQELNSAKAVKLVIENVNNEEILKQAKELIIKENRRIQEEIDKIIAGRGNARPQREE